MQRLANTNLMRILEMDWAAFSVCADIKGTHKSTLGCILELFFPFKDTMKCKHPKVIRFYTKISRFSTPPYAFSKFNGLFLCRQVFARRVGCTPWAMRENLIFFRLAIALFPLNAKDQKNLLLFTKKFVHIEPRKFLPSNHEDLGSRFLLYKMRFSS